MDQNLRLGLAFSQTGEPVIVIGHGENFAVWNQNQVLLIYDADQGDVVGPLSAGSVWDAILLFSNWNSCNINEKLLQ
jgi:hypothetical protein